jgi:CRP-like cAMP-binding protein
MGSAQIQQSAKPVYPEGTMFVQFDPTAFVADPVLVQELEKRAAPVDCSHERILFEQDEPSIGLYIVHGGKVTMAISAEGQTIMQVETGPGSLLGLPGIIGNQPYSMTAHAQAGAQVFFISREDFTALMADNPQLSFKILQVLAAEVRTARQALHG